MKKKSNLVGLVIGSVIVFLMLRVIPQFHIIYDFWQLQNVSWFRKFEVLYQYSLGSFSLWQVLPVIITVLLAVMLVLNIIVFLAYVRNQKKILKKRSFFATMSGIILGVFGVGCVSCGALVIAPILTLIGLGGYATSIVQYALPLSIVGIILVIFSTGYLLKKISEPMVCTP